MMAPLYTSEFRITCKFLAPEFGGDAEEVVHITLADRTEDNCDYISASEGFSDMPMVRQEVENILINEMRYQDVLDLYILQWEFVDTKEQPADGPDKRD